MRTHDQAVRLPLQLKRSQRLGRCAHARLHRGSEPRRLCCVELGGKGHHVVTSAAVERIKPERACAPLAMPAQWVDEQDHHAYDKVQHASCDEKQHHPRVRLPADATSERVEHASNRAENRGEGAARRAPESLLPAGGAIAGLRRSGRAVPGHREARPHRGTAKHSRGRRLNTNTFTRKVPPARRVTRSCRGDILRWPVTVKRKQTSHECEGSDQRTCHLGTASTALACLPIAVARRRRRRLAAAHASAVQEQKEQAGDHLGHRSEERSADGRVQGHCG